MPAKEKQPKPDLTKAILLAFGFFNASERGMTKQAFFDALAPMGYTPKTIELRLKKLVRQRLLSVEESEQFGKIYRPTSRTSKFN